MITVGSPTMMGAVQPALSPIRAAGFPPTSTVALPVAIGVGGCQYLSFKRRAWFLGKILSPGGTMARPRFMD